MGRFILLDEAHRNPMDILLIQEKIRTGEYRFSEHAIKRMIKRGIDRYEVEEAIFGGELVETYPDDKYSPSCLICGKTRGGTGPSCAGIFPAIGCYCDGL